MPEGNGNILRMVIVKLRIAYDGTDFVGWQRQNLPGANNRSVQGELEKVLRRLLQQAVSVQGAGRTDSGVHAQGQVASFDLPAPGGRPLIPVERLAYAMNNRLPGDVRILGAECTERALDFHARFSAKSKEYRYFLVLSQAPGAFDYRYAWFCPYKLPRLADMPQAAAQFVGEHDFRGFCGRSSVVTTYVRRLSLADFSRVEPADAPPQLYSLAAEGALYCFRVVGNGFIYKMVRLLTGALVKSGRGQLEPAQIRRQLQTAALEPDCWPQPLAPAAPARGLYLWHIDY